MSLSVLESLHDSLVHKQGDGPLPEQHALVEPLLGEIWEARHGDAPAGSTPLASLDGLGARLVERGVVASQAVRLVLEDGRALVELGEDAGALDAAGARRLSALVDDAAVRLAAAVEQARRTRRQGWLSYLTHEIKNPLNTVLNALWLLREKGSDPKQASRFLELAERAVKRLESRTREVRELDENLLQPPSGWEPKTPTS